MRSRTAPILAVLALLPAMFAARKRPSAVLTPYGDNGLVELGRELDDLFAAIVADAASR